MSRERKRSAKLVQSRRQGASEEEDNETGPAIIDDSASEAASDGDFQLSGSDDDEDDEEHDPHPNQKTRDDLKGSVSPPTSEIYDRLEDDTLHGVEFVKLGASNGSVRPEKVNDTAIMLNGFKDIPTTMQFDELDDSISFEPRPSHTKTTSTSSTRGMSSSSSRGGARDRPDRETYWQRRNREKDEYKKRLEDPTFTPYVGEFFMHDSRSKRRQFDSLNQFGGPRGRGRGRGRGFRGSVQRDRGSVQRETTRDDQSQEAIWGHDGFEELEPQQPTSSKVHKFIVYSNCRETRVKPALLDDKHLN
jgi:CASC3/Barentsz eIF4AIII binding